MDCRCYFELRKASARGTGSLAADIARHLHTRQHLGKATLVCEQPRVMLSAVRKQWLKLSRVIQKQRAATLNADKILKYTHTITHMQHLRFTAKTPLDQPDADVYCLASDQLSIMPPQCWSLYIDARLSVGAVRTMLGQLPADALVIDYDHTRDWESLGLAPKKSLEERIRSEWQHAKRFLDSYHIDITLLTRDGLQNVEAIDDALDTLLGGASQKFLAVAAGFQRALELARPLHLNKKMREEYDSFMLLAHRVQALIPGTFTRQFLETYGDEDDTFFLHDRSKRLLLALGSTEELSEALHRHWAAGRKHLARALQLIDATNTKQDALLSAPDSLNN